MRASALSDQIDKECEISEVNIKLTNAISICFAVTMHILFPLMHYTSYLKDKSLPLRVYKSNPTDFIMNQVH